MRFPGAEGADAGECQREGGAAHAVQRVGDLVGDMSLDIADEAGVDIDHSCGGVCACSTCHVKVRKGLESCSKATEDEEDMHDTARDLDTDSRLSCQCVPDGSQDLVVLIPKWNKNLVKEGH